MKNEKIIEKIKNLLDLANNNPNENEAIAAALKAQELMAKYHIDSHDVEDVEITDEIIENSLIVGNGDKWKFSLASIIAKNFCCKVYYRGRVEIIFYGYRKDTEIAKSVFQFLFETGNKLADRCYYEYYKNNLPTKGVKNTYLMGYCEGIRSVLGRQCTALMIVTPKEVEDSYAEMTKHFSTMKSTIRMNGDNKAYEKGRTDGISTANARSIEG